MIDRLMQQWLVIFRDLADRVPPLFQGIPVHTGVPCSRCGENPYSANTGVFRRQRLQGFPDHMQDRAGPLPFFQGGPKTGKDPLRMKRVAWNTGYGAALFHCESCRCHGKDLYHTRSGVGNLQTEQIIGPVPHQDGSGEMQYLQMILVGTISHGVLDNLAVQDYAGHRSHAATNNNNRSFPFHTPPLDAVYQSPYRATDTMSSMKEIRSRLRDQGLENEYGYRKEVRLIPECLTHGEEFLAMSSGIRDGTRWFIVATSSRLLLLTKPSVGDLRLIGIVRDEIRSLSARRGLIFGSLQIETTQGSYTFTNVLKKSISVFLAAATPLPDGNGAPRAGSDSPEE